MSMKLMEPTVKSVGARSQMRRGRVARTRLSKVANARDTIEGFDRDTDLVGLTFGQFSLLDLVDAAINITGPVHVVISTWSAGFFDVESLLTWRDSGRMLSTRFLMDSSKHRGQAGPGEVAVLFGADNVRTFRSHAKFVLLSNDDGWHVVITTSMNLNLNPRMEQFDVTNDLERLRFFSGFVDACWEELPEGSTRDRTLPGLPGLVSVQPRVDIQMGAPVAVGLWDQ